MLLALLLMATMSDVEGRYKGLACYKCDYIMSFCTFRCRHQPSVAHSYYCNDFCDRRNERCYLECVEDRYGHASWGSPSIVEWRHYAKSRTEQDVGVLSDINVQVIKRLYINSICFFFQTLFTIYIRYPMKSDHNKIGYICRLICTIRLIHRMNMNHYGYF